MGGAAAGLWGGLAISRFSEATTEKRFWRRGAFSFFLAHVLVIIPATVIDVSSSKLPRLILLEGLVYGLVSGLLFGLLTAGLRRVLGVVLAAVAGFGLGGLLMGISLRIGAGLDIGIWRILAATVGFFFFGAAGGASSGCYRGTAIG